MDNNKHLSNLLNTIPVSENETSLFIINNNKFHCVNSYTIREILSLVFKNTERTNTFTSINLYNINHVINETNTNLLKEKLEDIKNLLYYLKQELYIDSGNIFTYTEISNYCEKLYSFDVLNDIYAFNFNIFDINFRYTRNILHNKIKKIEQLIRRRNKLNIIELDLD